jgi:hypothetical protein
MKAKLPASRFRAELFDALEAAHRGEEVIVTYKGQEYALMAKRKPSKFAHVKPRPGAVLDWKAVEEGDVWDEAAWSAKWEERLPSKRPKSRRH